MKSPAARSVRLSVEELEAREVPSVGWNAETFENSELGKLPTGWIQWNNLTSGSSFQVVNGTGFGSDNGLISMGTSDLTARAWQTGTFEKDVQVQADIFLNSLAPLQIFARGQTLDTSTPTYYAVSVTRGMEVTLQRVVNGQSTTLAMVNSAVWLSSQWVRVSLAVEGDRLTAQVFRTDTAQYLAANGIWQAVETNVIDLTDRTITSAGRVGMARAAKVAGQVAFDNFLVSTDAPDSTPATSYEQDFGSNLVRGLPTGWASYTNTSGQSFMVAASNKALTGSSAVGVGGSSGLVARTWYDTSLNADSQVSASLFLDSLVPAQIFARGQDLDTDSPDYYAVSIMRGATVQLVRVVDGRTTILGSITTDSWLSQQWVQVTLSTVGSTLQVQVYRTDSGQYLTSDGQWQVAPTWAIMKSDTAIQGPGKTGIGRASGYSGSVSFDNFVVTSATGSNPTTPPPAVSPTLNYDFDSNTIGALPAGWNAWTKGATGAFQVTSTSSMSNPNGLSSNGGSDAAARAWFTGQTYSDAQITASMYVDSLTPSQIFARGQALATDSPSYYAVSITRGLVIQLNQVVAGKSTTLATIGSKTYLSGLWLSVTLRTTANTIEVIVQRQDTGQYLAADSTWQASAATAISLTDGAISDAGNVGLSRPASYSGRVLFDDVAIVDLSNDPPLIPADDSSNTDVTPGSGTGGSTTSSGIQYLDHIRIAQLAYYGTPIGDNELKLLRSAVDLVVANPVYLDQMEAASPLTTKLIYSNVSNIYVELLSDWLAFADRKGLDREGAFYHVNKATAFTGDSSSSRPVNWFWAVQRGNDVKGWTDYTTTARKNAENFALGSLGESVAIGYTEKFRELNVSLKSGAANGWTGVLEYVSAVDAAGNPSAWSTLTTLTNATSGFRTSGQITFDPPSNWKSASINGSDRYFYIRVRTTQSGTAPVASTVLGRDYVSANDTTKGVIPAFDATADVNGDGYLNDQEYARRKAGFNARFEYESRLFYPAYGQMRFATNPANAGFREWSADFSFRYLAGHPNADGLFIDNSFGKLQVDAAGLKESIATYAEDYGTLLAAINKKIAPRWVLANTAGAGKSAEPMVRNGVAYLEEFALRPLVSNHTQFEDMAALVASRFALSGGKGYAILDTYPQGGSPTDARTQIAQLAYYYLLADPNQSFLMFNGGYEPATAWSRHWTEAVRYDVGAPTNSWSIFATGLDPANRNLTFKIYEREYENALVLYKPLSYTLGKGTGTLAAATATTHDLGGTYRLLNANGTLGSPITKITLRNGEGAILIKS